MEIYYTKSNDIRAIAFQNYLRYASNSKFDILLMRYGFEFEDFDWLKPCIDAWSEDELVFNEKINQLDEKQIELIKRYI
jgi:hypothetical protein